ncbi:MAG: metal ABC transporter permease [Chthoniobacterales bacterium]|nr:metal ABC transporter permease [Chthoniobacterales bacterium]
MMHYLSYDFVQNALIAGSIAAALGAVVGYFVIIRNIGFAAHALAHIGFTGATGAILFGLSPLQGMLVMSSLAGATMGISGNRFHRSELAIGMVLSISLGLGTLFLSLYQGFAGEATAILFGNIFGVSHAQVIETIFLSALSLFLLALFSRRLLFTSIQPDLAESRGLSLTFLSTAFMIILAISVALVSQVVGTLLVFTLLIGPAGIATRLSHSFWRTILLSLCIGIVSVWSGIFLACLTNQPPSFWITSILFVLYIFTELKIKLFESV